MRFIVPTLLLLFSIYFVQAQYPYYQHIAEEQGLPGNNTYCIAQDSAGFIWVGTAAGLYRYNGTRFIRYASSKQTSTSIGGIENGRDGKLYSFSFSNQLFVLQGDSLYSIDSWQGKRITGFPCIAVSNDGTLWASSDKGIYSYTQQSDTWKLYDDYNNNGVKDSNVLAGRITAQGNSIWYLSQAGVGCIKNGKSRLYDVQYRKEDSKLATNYIISADDNNVWLTGVTGGVYILKGDVFIPYQNEMLNKLLQGSKVTTAGIHKGQLYFLTYSGIVIHDSNTGLSKLMYEKEAFADYLIDRDGRWWLCTINNGIYYIPNNSFAVWNKQISDIAEERITHIAKHEEGIAFSMQNGSIAHIDETNRITIMYANKGNDVGELFYDAKGSLVFNENNGLYAIENGKAKMLVADAGPVKQIINTGKQYVVATSLGTKLYEYNWKYLSTINLNWSRALAYDTASNMLYIATNNGVEYGQLSNNSYQYNSRLLEKIQILGVCAGDNNVFAITYKGALYSIDKGKAKLLTELKQAMPTGSIVYAQHKIYVATGQGLFIYDTTTNKWQQLNSNDGIAGKDINELLIADSTLWIATSKGLQQIPAGYVAAATMCKVVLRSVKISGNESRQFSELQLMHTDGITLYPEAINYTTLKGSAFAYRLDGADTNWTIAPLDAEELFIPSLPSGNFAIELKLIDDKGRSSANTIRITGYVLPPFWQRWWFYVLIGTTVLFIAYLIFNHRIKTLQRKQQQKLQRIQLENEVNLSQQAALKAQMNPHFIFNVLNSIKGYIYDNDKKAAADYLGKFAKLIRKILDASNQPSIKLSDELEALELYIQLEAMLLQPPFKYAITISEEVDADAIRIPSLIIQPFVENSFKHGLIHKQGEKHLTVNISMHNTDTLLISIADNGIGLEASKKATIDLSHQSFATAANNKRLQLISKHKAEAVRVTFAPMPEGGTIVKLYIQT